MQPSSRIVLALTILAAATLFFYPAPSNLTPEQIELFKTQFLNFKQKFNRRYDETEEKFRFQIFIENLRFINKHNLDPTKTYKMGITQFADITEQQFIHKVLNPELSKMQKDLKLERIQVPGTPPASIDWRGKGVITPVYDQGDCGSSWTFSATGTMESVLAVKNKTLYNFSKQQLLDCCTYAKYGCEGCKGAFPDWALSYVKDAGIVLDSEYPFTTWKDDCKPIPTARKLLNHTKPFSIISNQTLSIKNALNQYGPLSVSVDAYKWQFYVSGVYNDCYDDHVTTACLLVGYQEDGAWILRNSWGTTWGEQGYIRVANKGDACLIKYHVVIPHFA